MVVRALHFAPALADCWAKQQNWLRRAPTNINKIFTMTVREKLNQQYIHKTE